MDIKLTLNEELALLSGYNELYQNFLKAKRCRETPEIKQIMIANWREKCLAYQGAIRKLMPNNAIIFKELK